jgi:hypothetical protein
MRFASDADVTISMGTMVHFDALIAHREPFELLVWSRA